MKALLLTMPLTLLSIFCYAQKAEIFRIDSFPEQGILLNKFWKWTAGDDPNFAKPGFDDSTWKSINPTKDVMSLPEFSKDGQVYWLRLSISIDKSVEEQIMMSISQMGASDIYLNGSLIHSFGIIHKNPQQTKAFDPYLKPFSFPIVKDSIQLLAVRYAFQPNVTYATHFGHIPSALNIRLNTTENAVSNYMSYMLRELTGIYFKGGIHTILFILFITLYIFFPSLKANLYFAIFNFLLAIAWAILFPFSFFPIWVDDIFWILNTVLLLQAIGYLFKLTSVYYILEQKRSWFFYGVVVLGIISMITGTFIYGWGWILFGFFLTNILNLDIIRVAVVAARNQKKGAWIIITGGIIYLVTWFLFSLQFYFNADFSFLGFIQGYFFHIALLSIPVAFAIFLGYDFGITNSVLQQKLTENAVLSEEKQNILATQNETLEKQVAQRTTEVQQSLNTLKSTQAQLIQAEKMATLTQQAEAIRLKELDALKTKLYTNITHEFRTPLTVILGVASQVLDNPNEHLKKGLNMIMRNGQNLLTLVNQMLDLSKLESGKLSLQYQNADIISYLGYIVDSFHSLAESKGIQIHFISVAEQLNLDFDEVRLQQVVSNIISNSIKFTPKGGNVYVSTDTKNDNFVIKIKDTGIGIDEADLPHIFDRFYQADDSPTRHGEGTGIGLALTNELVKLMKGTIAVKSKKGQGTEFEVVLPFRNISDSKERSDQVPLESMETDTIHEYPLPIDEVSQSPLVTPVYNENGSAHVLIADDNEDVLSFIASCLENDFAVDVAKNGQECEEIAFNSTPDLIVMDVMMPLKDGFEVCKTLKSDERTSHIPIIMLTAKADLKSKLQGLEQGADDYLTKPFHKKELLLRIKNLLDLRRQLQQYYRSSLEGNLSEIPLPNQNDSGSKRAPSVNQKPSIPIASSLENAFVIKVRKTIETHMEEPNFDVEKLCRFLALSRSQVHRKLSALTGLSATHFIRYVRLIKAKEMILKSGFSINAIAYDCGFNDPGYFGRIFKQEFGISPHVWREQNSTE